MPHTGLLGFQIKQIMGRSRHLKRYSLSYLHSKFFQLIYLIRVIRQKSDTCSAQIPQNLRSNIIFPLIPGKSQREVGLQRIHPLFLQFISPHFIDKPDPAPLLPHIKQNSPSLSFYLHQSGGKLLSAVAPQRAKDITSQTLGMNAA